MKTARRLGSGGGKGCKSGSRAWSARNISPPRLALRSAI